MVCTARLDIYAALWPAPSRILPSYPQPCCCFECCMLIGSRDRNLSDISLGYNNSRRISLASSVLARRSFVPAIHFKTSSSTTAISPSESIPPQITHLAHLSNDELYFGLDTYSPTLSVLQKSFVRFISNWVIARLISLPPRASLSSASTTYRERNLHPGRCFAKISSL